MPGKGRMQITGKLGDVMQESVKAAKSFVRSKCLEYGINKGELNNTTLIKLVNKAASGGNYELFKYLENNQIFGKFDYSKILTKQLFSNAALGGCLKICQYLYDIKCPWDEKTCSAAVKNCYGHKIEILKFLHEKGCPWNEETCACAAENIDLECLKYAHEKGCPWDEKTSYNAARLCRLDNLKYLIEKECPFDEKICNVSIINSLRGVECTKYLHEKGFLHFHQSQH